MKAPAPFMIFMFLSHFFASTMGDQCPLSSRIHTEEDLVFSYDVTFFTEEELRGYPDDKKFLCPHSWIHFSNCTEGLCPLRKENVDSLMEYMTWEPYHPAICDLRASNEKEEPYELNVFIFGSSFTAGSATKIDCCSEIFGNQSLCTDFHPGGDNWYCAWPGYFLRWLEQEFPNSKINGANFGRSGYSSLNVANEIAWNIQGNNITQRDIILLDLSITDTGMIQQRKLHEVAEALESIMLTLYRSSRDGLPTIILLDQWPHQELNPGPKPRNFLRRSSASALYYNISKHYNLPFWSTKRVLWSDFAAANQRHFIDRLLAFGTHPDFSYHLLFADLLASGFMSALQNCKGDGYRSSADLPSLYFPQLHIYTCDPMQPPRIEAVPRSTMTPTNLDDFESNLIGWTDFTDHHNVPGFIINNFAKKRILSFPLNYSVVTDLEGEVVFVTHLKTYRNAGRFQLAICGKPLDTIVDTYHSFHVSVPSIYVERLVSNLYDACPNIPPSQRSIDIIYTPHFGTDGVDHGDPRGHEKVKILAMHLCSPMV